MNFDEWLNEEIAKLKRISTKLKEEFNTVDRDYQKWLFEDAKEPWGFSRQKPMPAAASQKQEDRKDFRPITAKQVDLINRHMKGNLGPRIAAMIGKTGKPLEGLSTSEASAIIDFIMGGGK